MEEDILEGHYLLKNHRKVCVISSSNGHHPISGGRKLMIPGKIELYPSGQ